MTPIEGDEKQYEIWEYNPFVQVIRQAQTVTIEPSSLDQSNGFIAAWLEPRHGFETTWLELEIIIRATRWIPVNQLREGIISRYTHVAEVPLSSFYRTVTQLVKQGYLTRQKKGRETLVKRTNKGNREIGRAARYFFDLMMAQLGKVLRATIRQVVKDTLKTPLCSRKMLAITPRPGDIYKLWKEEKEEIEETHLKKEMEGQKKEREKQEESLPNGLTSLQVPPEELCLTPKYLLVPLRHRDRVSQPPEGLHIQVLSTDFYSLDLKDNIVETGLLSRVISLLSKEQEEPFFSELKRVLQPNAPIFFIEETVDVHTPLVGMWKMLAQLSTHGLSSQLEVDRPKYSKYDVLDRLSKWFTHVEVKMDGLITIFYCINEKEAANTCDE